MGKIKTVLSFLLLFATATVLLLFNTDTSTRHKIAESYKFEQFSPKIHENEEKAKKEKGNPALSSYNNGLCEKVGHVVYAKTHKTASSTLNTVIGKAKVKPSVNAHGIPSGMLGGYPAPFNASLVYYKYRGDKYKLHKPGMELFDMVTGHMVFNKQEIEKIVPADTKYVTILRNPLDQILSTFNFYYTMRNGCNIYQCLCSPFIELFNWQRLKSVDEFLNMPLHYVNRSLPMFFRARNFQAYDLGFDAMNEDKEYLKTKTKELDKTFDLVLIAEYFDESLILLKNVLCLTLDDIYYYSKNNRIYEKPVLSRHMIKNMNKFYHQDFYLHDYFNKTLWRKIDEFGRDRMENELKEYREHKQKKQGDDKQEDIYIATNVLPLEKYGAPYTYQKDYRYIFNNPTHNHELEMAQRMKLETIRYQEKKPKYLKFLNTIDYIDLGAYVSQYTAMCKVSQAE